MSSIDIDKEVKNLRNPDSGNLYRTFLKQGYIQLDEDETIFIDEEKLEALEGELCDTVLKIDENTEV